MPLPALVSAALVTGGASVLGNLINTQNVQSTNQAQKDLLEYQYQKNLEQWNRENEYNKPVNQMARLREAGINPNMVFGSLSGNVAASSPSYGSANLQAPQVDLSGVGSSASQIAVAKYNQAALDNAKKMQELEIAGKELENAGREVENDNALKQGYSLDIANAEAKRQLGYNFAVEKYRLSNEMSQLNQQLFREAHQAKDWQADYISKLLNNAKTIQETRAVEAGIALTKLQANATQAQINQVVTQTRAINNEYEFNKWCREMVKTTGVNPAAQHYQANAAAAVIAAKIKTGLITPQEAKAWVYSGAAAGISSSSGLWSLIGNIVPSLSNAAASY